jgi:hypothetical protein
MKFRHMHKPTRVVLFPTDDISDGERGSFVGCILNTQPSDISMGVYSEWL